MDVRDTPGVTRSGWLRMCLTDVVSSSLELGYAGSPGPPQGYFRAGLSIGQRWVEEHGTLSVRVAAGLDALLVADGNEMRGGAQTGRRVGPFIRGGVSGLIPFERFA